MNPEGRAAVAGEFGVTLPPRPYPGLRPFQFDEWPIFFGRERMIDEVSDRLVTQQLLVVHGDSGCGKSSLIRAGVLPRLKQDSARGGTSWTICTVTPGDAPVANVARALAALRPAEDQDALVLELRRILNSGQEGAAALVERLGGDRGPYVCLLIDQFEEIFAHARLHGPHQASLLVGLLIGLARRQTPRLFVILTMRSEFLGACAQFEGFAEEVNGTQYLLPRMAHADLVRAICEPATLYGGTVAPALAERLIAEVRGRQDQLPLIQHGLMLLHRQKTPVPGTPWRLTLDDYRAPGGLSQLLSDHADEVMAQVEPADGRVTEDLFRALTDINADGQAIRRPQRFRDLVAICGAGGDALRRIVDGFRAEGVSFLRPYGTEPIADDEPMDISHEALIRCWRRIAGDDGWLEREFRNGLVWRSLLVQADSFERDPSNVLSPATAEERNAWLRRRNAAWAERYGGGWPRVVRLVEASVAERQRRLDAEIKTQSELAVAAEKVRRVKLFRWGMVISLALLAVAVWAAITAFQERQRALQESLRANDAAAVAKVERQRALNAQREAERRREIAERSAATVLDELERLRRAAAAAPAGGALQQQIKQADDRIKQGAYALLSARIYIHYSGEAQRAPAEELARRIAASRLGDTTLIVPAVQRVDDWPPRALLRCFVGDECAKYGQPLVDLVNRQLSTPKLRLQDFSATYTPDGRIRPLHFEIYFPSVPLVLEAPAAKAY